MVRLTAAVVRGLLFFEEATSTGFGACSVKACRLTIMLQNYITPKIAPEKCTKWNCLDSRLCTCTYGEVCSQLRGKSFWWSHHLTLFSFSMASGIPRPNACGFWSYIKYRVYMCNPKNLRDLKDFIKHQSVNIPHVILCSSSLSTSDWDSNHVENAWFK